MKEHTIKKSVCDKYTIRLPNLQGWAIIIVDESQGVVSIISDYGNWGYVWSHHGRRTLKQFLTEIDSYYAWEKFTGSKKIYNHEKTVKTIKQKIQDMEDSQYITKEVGIKLREELDQLEYESNEDTYRSEILTNQFSDIYELFCYDQDPQFNMFFNLLWKPFVEHIKSEVQQDIEKLEASLEECRTWKLTEKELHELAE
jgi:hypothetical protein